MLLDHEQFRLLGYVDVHVSYCFSLMQEDNHVELQASSISGTAKVGQESDNILILQKLPKQPKYLQVC